MNRGVIRGIGPEQFLPSWLVKGDPTLDGSIPTLLNSSAGGLALARAGIFDATAKVFGSAGADPLHLSDSYPGIAAALSAASNAGGRVLLPQIPGGSVYNLSSPITIGNGSTAAYSTVTNVHCGGPEWAVGMPIWSPDNTMRDQSPTSQPILKWTGGATATPMVTIQGPIIGWGLPNLVLDGGKNAPCLELISAQRGYCRYLMLRNWAGYAIRRTTVGTASGGFTGQIDGMHNVFEHCAMWFAPNMTTFTPPVGDAFVYAITAERNGASSGNVCYDDFSDLSIVFAGGTTLQCALLWQSADNLHFRGVHFATFDSALSGSTIVRVDFRDSNYWPADCLLTDVDFGTNSANAVTQSGTPVADVNGKAPMNRITNISTTNKMPANPNLSGVDWQP